MHVGAMAFVGARARLLGPFMRVVEIGGRNVNGSVRGLFAEAYEYTCIDLLPGQGVDVVDDAAGWEPLRAPDAVVCCEVLEHAPDPEALVMAAYRWLVLGGVFILTTACEPRAPHSAIDGGPLKPGEFYANVDPADLERWLKVFGQHEVAATASGDLYAYARKV